MVQMTLLASYLLFRIFGGWPGGSSHPSLVSPVHHTSTLIYFPNVVNDFLYPFIVETHDFVCIRTKLQGKPTRHGFFFFDGFNGRTR